MNILTFGDCSSLESTLNQVFDSNKFVKLEDFISKSSSYKELLSRVIDHISDANGLRKAVFVINKKPSSNHIFTTENKKHIEDEDPILTHSTSMSEEHLDELRRQSGDVDIIFPPEISLEQYVSDLARRRRGEGNSVTSGFISSTQDGMRLDNSDSNWTKEEDVIGNLILRFQECNKIAFGEGALFLSAISGADVMIPTELKQGMNLSSNIRASFLDNSGEFNDFPILADMNIMLNPYVLCNSRFEIIVWAKYFNYKDYLHKESNMLAIKGFVEPYIVRYKETNSFCFGIEFKRQDSTSKRYIKMILNKIFN